LEGPSAEHEVKVAIAIHINQRRQPIITHATFSGGQVARYKVMLELEVGRDCRAKEKSSNRARKEEHCQLNSHGKKDRVRVAQTPTKKAKASVCAWEKFFG
jgi:hypothetical protein